MDRNTLIGMFLIGLILIGYSIWMQPSPEEVEKIKRQQDSIAAVEQREAEKRTEKRLPDVEKDVVNGAATDTVIPDSIAAKSDSINQEEIKRKYGIFADAVTGEDKEFIIETELLKATIAKKGGRIKRVELKKYKTHDSLPLLLFHEDSSTFNLNFFYNNRLINTEELYFEPVGETFDLTGNSSREFAMRLYAGSKGRYIEYLYTFKGDDYLVDFTLNVVGLGDVVAANAGNFGLEWNLAALSKEKGIDNERNATTVYYKYKKDEVDYLSETSDDEEDLIASVSWVSFKQQFFSAAIISNEGFDKANANVAARTLEGSDKYTRYLATNLSIPFQLEENPSFPMRFYFGPNHYQTLKSVGMDLEEQIDLGWGIFGWVNKFLVIPIFNFLDGFNLGYGIIILLLTIFIKTLLFPLTYKNYKSSAKMKVLKPEIDELTKKYKDDEPMKKQQATMALYRKAGVNPMAGCVPMLLQMPILYAMFRFFPSSIELRQESFLWAEDLSTYDSIMQLPFTIPFYGDHVSLFTLLMAGSTMLYTKFNTQMTMNSGPQAAQMKMMMYIMPVFLLVFFNSFPAGLSYYYFSANIISMAQQFVIKKWFIDEDKIHKQIQAHKKKPGSAKKSKFQKRLEEMAKKKGYKPPKR